MNTTTKWGLFTSTVLLAAAISSGLAVGPPWWTNRSVLTTDSPSDYAAANQGQVKNIARKAFDEMEALLNGGAGSTLSNQILTLSASNSYDGVNVGQLKGVAKPFYDRLAEAGYTNAYPWTVSTTDDQDFAAVNIGQVKVAFDWTLDADNDGMPDWWENIYGLSRTNAADAATDADGDGLSNLAEFQGRTSPANSNTAPPIVVIAYPANNAVEVLLP